MKLSIKLLCVITTQILLISCRNGEDKSHVAQIPANIITAESYNGSTVNEFPFISKPYRSSELSFRVGGSVNTLELNPGNYYGKGEIIAAIDPRDYQIKHNKAKASYEFAQSEYKRIEALYNLNNISESIYEKAKSDYKSALAGYDFAKNDLSDTKLTAPFNGYIQEVMFEQHQDVKPSQPICSFIDVSHIKIELFVTQQVAMALTKGDKISVVFDAMTDKEFTATIEDVSKGTTKNNLSFLVTAVIANSDNKLPAGLSGKAIISCTTSNNESIVIPQKVIRHTPTKSTYVWRMENCKAVSIPITTGKLQKNGLIEVTNGLNRGDTIISNSIELLYDGAQIMIQNE